MGPDTRALEIQALIEEGDIKGAKVFAARSLRQGNVDQELADVVADLLEAKPQRGAPDKTVYFKAIARTIYEQTFDGDREEALIEGRDPGPEPSRYGALKLAYAVAEREHGCTRRQAEYAWSKYGEARRLTARETLELMEGFEDLTAFENNKK